MFILAFLSQIALLLPAGNYLPVSGAALLLLPAGSLLFLLFCGMLLCREHPLSIPPALSLPLSLLLLFLLLLLRYRYLFSLALPEDRKLAVLFFLLLTLLPFFRSKEFPALHEAPFLGLPVLGSLLLLLLILLFTEKATPLLQMPLAFWTESVPEEFPAASFFLLLPLPGLQFLLCSAALGGAESPRKGRKQLFWGSFCALLTHWALLLLSASVLGCGLMPQVSYPIYSALGINAAGTNTGMRIVLLFFATSLSSFTALGIQFLALKKALLRFLPFACKNDKISKN